jgi:eukaryotic-like serine/threonine-protein kinase
VRVTPGTNLGPYQIVAAVGAGGMGDVFKATDTRLNRTVAIKILHAGIADKLELKQRFEREAQAVAALNHPHICVLYDIGQQDGTDYIVMEHLDGETLADRLAGGPLPLEHALRYAIEIADALDKAHRHGVVHRDLKPGNIMITKSGAKLLDFGLAKLTQPASAAAPSQSLLPTAVSGLTAEGSIIGTLQYMAPEQLEGHEADARADIFAFGATFYEMLTGRRAFQGKSQASVIGAILKDSPEPIQKLLPLTPPHLDHVVQRCLAKDPDDRWQSAGDLVGELRWIQQHRTDSPAPSTAAPLRSRFSGAAWALAALFFVTTAALATAYWRSGATPVGETPLLRISIVPPDSMTFEGGDPVISPDGRRIVFSASNSLWVRSLDSPAALKLAGTDNTSSGNRFWSPDAKSIGFFADSKLKTIDIAGGTPQAIADAGTPRGGAWNRDGVILFAQGNQGLFSVKASGGKPVPATKLSPERREIGHMWPDFLPDGRHFLYFSQTPTAEDRAVYAGALDSSDTKLVLKASGRAIYAEPGYLLYLRQGVLVAQRFDPDRLEVRGDPIPVTDGVRYLASIGYFQAFVSKNGILAYRSGGDTSKVQLTWFGRDGQKVGTAGEPGSYANFSLSPDGRRIALDRTDQETIQRDIWVMDVERGSPTRLTFNPADESSPRWSADGRRLFFNSNRDGISNCYQKVVDGSAEETPVRKSDGTLRSCNDVSPDGRVLLFHSRDAATGFDVWSASLSGGDGPTPFVKTPYHEGQARFSPDGTWVAYASEESGRQEIYVRRFTGSGEKHQISTGGGWWPRWRHDGRELFYMAGGQRVMAVSIETAPAFSAGVPRALFQVPDSLPVGGGVGIVDPFDASPDGQRFLLSPSTLNPSEPLSLIVNWTALLKK